MHPPRHQNAENSSADAPDLQADLQTLYGRRVTVPTHIDEALQETIAGRWRGPGLGSLRWRRPLAWTAAAAALLLSAVWANQPNPRPVAPALVEARSREPADIDGNGRIDILDAYRLARNLETQRLPRPGAPGWHDLNQDGAMNRLDVDIVAYLAVRVEGRPG